MCPWEARPGATPGGGQAFCGAWELRPGLQIMAGRFLLLSSLRRVAWGHASSCSRLSVANVSLCGLHRQPPCGSKAQLCSTRPAGGQGEPLSAQHQLPSRAGGERIQHVWVDVVKFMATSGSHKYIRAKYEVRLWPQRPQLEACAWVGLWASAGWRLPGCRHLVWESLLEDILSIKKKERNKNIKKYIKK